MVSEPFLFLQFFFFLPFCCHQVGYLEPTPLPPITHNGPPELVLLCINPQMLTVPTSSSLWLRRDPRKCVHILAGNIEKRKYVCRGDLPPTTTLQTLPRQPSQFSLCVYLAFSPTLTSSRYTVSSRGDPPCVSPRYVWWPLQCNGTRTVGTIVRRPFYVMWKEILTQDCTDDS